MPKSLSYEDFTKQDHSKSLKEMTTHNYSNKCSNFEEKYSLISKSQFLEG